MSSVRRIIVGTSRSVGAGKHLKDAHHPGVKLAGMAIAAAGPAVAAHTARQVGKTAGKGHLKARSPQPADAMGAAKLADRVEADKVGPQEAHAPSRVQEATTLSEFADALGVRQPPEGAENLCHLGICAEEGVGSVTALVARGRLAGRRPCDDLRLVGLKLIFLIVTRAKSAAGLVVAGVVVEGRRDPDPAPSARCRPARAAPCSCQADMAGPGVAGCARRNAASRAVGGDAAHRNPGHDLALAS